MQVLLNINVQQRIKKGCPNLDNPNIHFNLKAVTINKLDFVTKHLPEPYRSGPVGSVIFLYPV